MDECVTPRRDALHDAFEAQEDIGAQALETTDFEKLSAGALSRRRFLGAGAALGLSAFVLGTTALTRPAAASRFGFKAVPASTADTVVVPEGFEWQVLARWGDPLWSDGEPFDQRTRGTAASQKRAFGDNTDGMALYSDGGRSVLAVNNEYVNRAHIFGNREDGKPTNADDVRKGMPAHGVSVFEIEETGSGWRVVVDSSYNRRVTATTPMEITGPARGHDLVRTAADPEGVQALGT